MGLVCEDLVDRTCSDLVCLASSLRYFLLTDCLSIFEFLVSVTPSKAILEPRVCNLPKAVYFIHANFGARG